MTWSFFLDATSQERDGKGANAFIAALQGFSTGSQGGKSPCGQRRPPLRCQDEGASPFLPVPLAGSQPHLLRSLVPAADFLTSRRADTTLPAAAAYWGVQKGLLQFRKEAHVFIRERKMKHRLPPVANEGRWCVTDAIAAVNAEPRVPWTGVVKGAGFTGWPRRPPQPKRCF